jgi:hypothetical protein
MKFEHWRCGHALAFAQFHTVGQRLQRQTRVYDGGPIIESRVAAGVGLGAGLMASSLSHAPLLTPINRSLLSRHRYVALLSFAFAFACCLSSLFCVQLFIKEFSIVLWQRKVFKFEI